MPRNINKDLMENDLNNDRATGSQADHWDKKKKSTEHGINPVGSRGDNERNHSSQHDMGGSRTNKK